MIDIRFAVLFFACSIFCSMTRMDAQTSISLGTQLGIADPNHFVLPMPMHFTFQRELGKGFQLGLDLSRVDFRHGPVIDYGKGDLVSIKYNSIGLHVCKFFTKGMTNRVGLVVGVNNRYGAREQIYAPTGVETSPRTRSFDVDGFGIPVGLRYERQLNSVVKFWTTAAYHHYFRGESRNHFLLDINLGFRLYETQKTQKTYKL